MLRCVRFMERVEQCNTMKLIECGQLSRRLSTLYVKRTHSHASRDDIRYALTSSVAVGLHLCIFRIGRKYTKQKNQQFRRTDFFSSKWSAKCNVHNWQSSQSQSVNSLVASHDEIYHMTTAVFLSLTLWWLCCFLPCITTANGIVHWFISSSEWSIPRFRSKKIFLVIRIQDKRRRYRTVNME